ncbi:MAG TPA: amidase [Gemmatimonadaceae bacterium]|jgi:aspartyl-tRNA(Asn)/glutamyl-tRNA(Gln) amidotransferase subunit A
MPDALALADRIRKGRLSPVELVDETLDRIARENPRLNAFLAVFDETARTAARRADRLVRRRGATSPPLLGVPVSVKDLVLTTEAPTTAGSRIFGDGLVAEHDATVVRRLRRAGAIVIGKTNLHEVALGVTSANEHFGPVRNPFDPERVAGGSSGGSAAAVAAGLGPLSVGTDTRGSIRIPAACCGVTGLKPTRGLVPLDGVVPLSPSLDHVGPIARSAAECALMLEVMAGSRHAGKFLRATRRAVRGMRVGVSEFHLRDLDAMVQKPVEAAIRELGKLGCRLRDVRAPELDEAHLASIVISASEAVAYHDRFLRTTPDAYGPLVRKRLQDAYRWSALELLRARSARHAVALAFDRLFADMECLVGAVLPAIPPRIGETTVSVNGQTVGVVDAFTRLNAPQNMAGVPALSVPCGIDGNGLPVGLQMVAARGLDDAVLRLGAAFQRATDWHSGDAVRG